MHEQELTEQHRSCPFCNNMKLLMITHDNCPPTFYQVACPSCQTGGPLGTTPEQALELWNNRCSE